MRAAVIGGGHGTLTLADVPRPEIGTGDVLVRVHAAGVCATDLMGIAGTPAGAPSRVPGHEITGVIEAVGSGVTEVAVGDRVGAYLMFACGECEPCALGEEECCERGALAGITTDGGYAEYVRLPARSAIPLPDGLAFDEAAPFFCAGLTSYAGLLNGGLQAGQRVAIVGIGGLGHLAIPIAKALGAEVVAVTSSPAKHELARSLGADHVLTGDADAGAALKALGGAHVVLNTASAVEPLANLVAGLRPLARVVLAGVGAGPVPIPAGALARNQIGILGSFIGSRAQMVDLLALAQSARIRPTIERYSLSEVGAVHDRLRANEIRFRAVMTP
ncbi:MAG: alcohol dehydrogenase catalytic domain-containing protein [Chloroflexi bacterium]|nr:alcohol dehydrogenase catalytic domain-containing protein [Chloroflexota bacterium]MDA1004053.1 alcohol dehydrogenase catalytic domain-containing protein [Chloroflexota bacterium]